MKETCLLENVWRGLHQSGGDREGNKLGQGKVTVMTKMGLWKDKDVEYGAGPRGDRVMMRTKYQEVRLDGAGAGRPKPRSEEKG